MSKNKKSKKADRGVFAEAARFASRNRRTLGLAGAGLAAAAALFLGQRYRERAAAKWGDDEVAGAAI